MRGKKDEMKTRHKKDSICQLLLISQTYLYLQNWLSRKNKMPLHNEFIQTNLRTNIQNALKLYTCWNLLIKIVAACQTNGYT